MKNKPVYQLSGKQILLVGLTSAVIAVFATGLIWGLTSLVPGFAKTEESAVQPSEQQQPAANINDPSTVSDEQNNIEVYRSMSPGVAFINTTSYTQDWWGDVQEGRGNGSGSVIDDQGHILTNYHVIEGAQKLSVSFGGDKTYPATVVGGDPDTDLAVIKIDPPKEGLTVISYGDSDKLTVGQKVLAIGNPFGLDRTLTTGVISGLQRPIRARNDRPIDAAIQTDASINPGNSGGPLLDKYGKMIGINSQILSPAGGSVGVGFAIPVNTAKRVVPQLIQNGVVMRPKLGVDGVSVQQLIERGNRMPVEKGFLLFSVSNGSPAANAGLKGLSRSQDRSIVLGDILLNIDNQPVNNLDDLYRILDKRKVGETVEAEVFRDGSTEKVPIRLTASGGGNTQRRDRRF